MRCGGEYRPEVASRHDDEQRTNRSNRSNRTRVLTLCVGDLSIDSIEAAGEDDSGGFSLYGLLWLLIGCAANAAYLVGSQSLMQGFDARVRLNPLTQMLFIGPLAALGVLVISYASGDGFEVGVCVCSFDSACSRCLRRCGTSRDRSIDT